jgi:RNA ligase (TIGR02306 family)
VVATIDDGWEVVTQKSNNFFAGDLCVYFEIDSFIRVHPLFEFLRPSSFKSTRHLGDGFRIKTIRLRGQLSQGLIVPLSDIRENFPDVIAEVYGDDLTESLGVQKYERSLSLEFNGLARGSFPAFIPKTDQERIQNVYSKLAKYSMGPFEVSIKLDGTSCTAYYYADNVGVCSRNLDLLESDSTLWKVVRKSGLLEALGTIGRDIAVQGEVMGPGIQGNREKLSDHELYVFDIWDISTQSYLDAVSRYSFMALLEERGAAMRHVPILHFHQYLSSYRDHQSFLDEADSTVSISHPVAEGLVFKSIDCPSQSFKVISNKFLLGEGE